MGTFSVGQRNSMLNAYARGTAFNGNTAVWVQLHTGTAGTAGTANLAGDTRRIEASYTDAAANGTITNTNSLEWTNVASTETLSDVSLWTSSSAGTFLGEDTLSSPAAVTAGDTFRIAIGDLDLSIS